MLTQKPLKSTVFLCEKCDFKSSKQSDYKKHLLTRKHNDTYIYLHKSRQKSQTIYNCNCGKEYKFRQSLYNHKKSCIQTNQELLDASANEVKVLTNIVLDLVKSNNAIQKQMINVCEKLQPNTINSNNITNTKIFNLQFFLNEECKDAMNMSEFINSIELNLSDLENMKKLGYVEGMSNIIIKQLNDTDLNKRPIHCSDAKREILYIKEENKWEKENSDNYKMIGAVKCVDKKNYMMLNKWKDEYPKCMDSESNQCDAYMKLVGIVMSGDTEHINKVIKKVSKEVLIDK